MAAGAKTARRGADYDAVIVGAGPSGLAAAAVFKRARLKYLHLERGRLAQTIFDFPRKIRLFSTADALEFSGVRFGHLSSRQPTREEYLQYLKRATSVLGLKVRTHTEVESIVPKGEDFTVRIRRRNGTFRKVTARNLVMASGGYSEPVRLNIPGEKSPAVSHYFRSELPAHGRRILVVGGRNSAVDAATVLAEKGAFVTLAYRKSRLPVNEIKPWLLPSLRRTCKEGRLKILYRAVPVNVRCPVCKIRQKDATLIVKADRVLLLTGYGPDYHLLRDAGVAFSRRTKRPFFDPNTFQTRTPGIFLCGTVVLACNGEKASIENTRHHGEVILRNLRKPWGGRSGCIPALAIPLRCFKEAGHQP